MAGFELDGFTSPEAESPGSAELLGHMADALPGGPDDSQLEAVVRKFLPDQDRLDQFVTWADMHPRWWRAVFENAEIAIDQTPDGWAVAAVKQIVRDLLAWRARRDLV